MLTQYSYVTISIKVFACETRIKDEKLEEITEKNGSRSLL